MVLDLITEAMQASPKETSRKKLAANGCPHRLHRLAMTCARAKQSLLDVKALAWWTMVMHGHGYGHAWI